MTPRRALYLPKLETAVQSANDEFDPYRATRKLPEPTACPKCHALFQGGRWTWEHAPKDSYELICPACHRIEDRFPAGFLMIKGDYALAHREEIVKFIQDLEKEEKAERPLKRIMQIENLREGMQVTTTDSQLARDIAESLQETYKGDLKLRYSRDENLLRATWKR